MMKKLMIVLFILVLLGLIGFAAIKQSEANKDRSVKVRVNKPELGKLVETISAPGEIKPLHSVTISAKISGKVIELPFEEGDAVFGPESGREPSVLVNIDSSDLESDLNISQARRESQVMQIEVAKVDIENRESSLREAEIQLAQKEKDLERSLKLLQSNDVTETSVEELQVAVEQLKIKVKSSQNAIKVAKVDLKVRENELKIADSNIQRAKDALEYAEISSPMSGVITQIHVKAGEMVTGAVNYTGTPMMVVADLSKMLLAAKVDEIDIGKVKEGQKAKVKLHAWPDERFEGVVHKKSLVLLDSRTGSKVCDVEIMLDNADGRILSGMTADAEIEIKVHENILTVPSQSVLGCEWETLPKEIRDGSELINKEKTYTPVVFRLIDGKAHATPVRIGPSDLTNTVIEAGLSIDDLVVTGPYKELEQMNHGKIIKDENAKEDRQGDKDFADKADDQEVDKDNSEDSQSEEPVQ